MKLRTALIAAALCIAAPAALFSQTVSQVVNSIIATTCTNQLVRSIAATGAGTCATVANADITAGTYSNVTGTGTLTAGATGAGFTVALTTSTITGNLPAANNTAIYGVFTKSAAQAYTASAAAQVTIDTADLNSGFSFGSNTVTINTTGKYWVSWCWTANGTLTAGQQMTADLRLNGSQTLVGLAGATGSNQGTACAQGILSIAATNTLTVFIQAIANTSTIAAGASGVKLAIHYVGP